MGNYLFKGGTVVLIEQVFTQLVRINSVIQYQYYRGGKAMKDTWNFLLPKRHEVKIFSTTSSHAVSFKEKEKKCQKALALLEKLYVIVKKETAQIYLRN